MARKIRTLSQSAVIELQRMQDRITALEQTRGANPVSVEAKAAYIVRTPSGGIPAATVGTTRVPGSATCVIHRRYRNTSNADRIDTTNRDQLVYNLTDTDIAGLSYVLAWRDAWGDLFAIPGTSTCPDLLSPGSYPAIAGAAIAAGATGSVVYDGVVYQAKNQSQCNVVIGDLVGLHISPTCEAFFVPCVCNCNQSGPGNCCDKYIGVCINNTVKILSLDAGSGTWSLVGCCDCDSGASVTVTLSCTGTTVTATWVYTCGEGTDTGTFDLSGLCDDPVVEYEDTITMRGCDVQIIATTDATSCDACSAPPEPDPPIDTECCENAVPETLWLEINGVSYAMVYDGDDWVYNGAIAGCATSVIFKVSCVGDTFTFVAANSGNNCAFNINTQSFVSCDPFELDVTFTVTDPFGTCPCVGAESGKVTA